MDFEILKILYQVGILIKKSYLIQYYNFKEIKFGFINKNIVFLLKILRIKINLLFT